MDFAQQKGGSRVNAQLAMRKKEIGTRRRKTNGPAGITWQLFILSDAQNINQQDVDKKFVSRHGEARNVFIKRLGYFFPIDRRRWQKDLLSIFMQWKLSIPNFHLASLLRFILFIFKEIWNRCG